MNKIAIRFKKKKKENADERAKTTPDNRNTAAIKEIFERRITVLSARGDGDTKDTIVV